MGEDQEEKDHPRVGDVYVWVGKWVLGEMVVVVETKEEGVLVYVINDRELDPFLMEKKLFSEETIWDDGWENNTAFLASSAWLFGTYIRIREGGE